MGEMALATSRRQLLLGLCCLLVLTAGPARAAEVKVEAMTLAQLPDRALIEIQPSEDSELAGVIAGTFADRLAQDGHSVTQQGSLVLRFAVEIDEFDGQRQPRVSVQGQGGGKQGVSGDVSVRLGSATSAKKANA